MKIAVLDIDQNQNLRLRQAVKAEAKAELVFCATLEQLLQILNAQSEIADKLKRMEKTLVDGATMLNRASDGIQKASQLAADKKAQAALLTTVAQVEFRSKIDSEIAVLERKIASARDLKTKIEMAINSRKAELEALAQTPQATDQKKVDLVLVDRAFLGNIPSDWNAELRDKITFSENKDVPVIAMGYNEDLNYIKNTLHGGVQNYFVKPLDQLLLRHSLNKVLKTNESDAKVFELQTQTAVRILKTATIFKMSEFELVVESNTAFQLNELVEFYVDIFGGEKDKRVLARCEASVPKEGTTSVTQSHFVIVGHTPHTMTEMRKWIRARYLATKKNEEG